MAVAMWFVFKRYFPDGMSIEKAFEDMSKEMDDNMAD